MRDDLLLLGYEFYRGNYIHPSAFVHPEARLGEGNIFHGGCYIGALGFIRNTTKRDGIIVIGNGNEFGLYTSVMIGEEGETIIGERNMFMNYVNIGHNVTIMNDNEIGAGTIIAGRTSIGSYNRIKTGCNVRNSIEIGDNNIIGMGSNVTKSVGSGGIHYGNPLRYIQERN